MLSKPSSAPCQDMVPLGVQFLCSRPGWVPWSRWDLSVLWWQGMLWSGWCFSWWGCSRNTSELFLLWWHQQSWGNVQPPLITLHPFSQCSATAGTAPLASSMCLLWGNSLLRTVPEAKAWGCFGGTALPTWMGKLRHQAGAASCCNENLKCPQQVRPESYLPGDPISKAYLKQVPGIGKNRGFWRCRGIILWLRLPSNLL